LLSTQAGNQISDFRPVINRHQINSSHKTV
ncbi:uncharacterized protein METZ01_LOCUS216897, partial [marine metagenome]